VSYLYGGAMLHVSPSEEMIARESVWGRPWVRRTNAFKCCVLTQQ
jgi:hypothetical protein